LEFYGNIYGRGKTYDKIRRIQNYQ
jgi:hypothetical protein